MVSWAGATAGDLSSARIDAVAQRPRDIDLGDITDWSAMDANADAAAALLKALANSQRLRILCLLASGEHSVREINAKVPLSQSALSQHLARLREDGLVTTRRKAQSIRYALADGPAARIIDTLYACYCSA